MNLETVLFEKSGGVARVTLNRPAQMNAISPSCSVTSTASATTSRATPRSRSSR